MPKLLDILTQPDVVLSLEPEELAGFVMQYIHSMSPKELTYLNRNNFGGSIFFNLHTCPPLYKSLDSAIRDEVVEAIMEAWFWLERDGFLVPKPGPNRDTFFISRRGQKVKDAIDLAAIRKADLLPRKLLHPLIAEKTWAQFLRGDYDTAVFQAFKEVEVAVREAGKFQVTDLGIDLMRKAFDRDHGPLRDKTRPRAEQDALAHLFAGTIALYKNPNSHRKVILEAEETIEMLMLASHLLRIVESSS